MHNKSSKLQKAHTTSYFTCCILLFFLPLLTAEQSISLFNGKDLTHWKATAHSDLWTVENGEIVGRWDQRKQNVAHSYLVHEGNYSDFHLSFEVKLVDNIGNSGVQFRSRMVGKHMKGYQADIGPGWWGKLYHEHGDGVLWKKSGESLIQSGQWNHYEIIAIGNRIQTRINGKVSVDYTDPKYREKEGFFALQLHWGLRAKEIRYRNLQLNLNPKPITKKYKVTAEDLKPGEEGILIDEHDKKYPVRSRSLTSQQSSGLAKKVDAAKFNDKRLGSNSRSANLSPLEQKKTFILQDGFEIELVASEQMGIKKIVDIAFDSSGRMWAVTASEYPADSMGSNVPFHHMLEGKGVQRSKRVEKLWRDGGIDQVYIFDNPCAEEGQVRNPIIFSEGHAMPVGVLPHKEGAFIIEGERLKFIHDRNQDMRADKVKLLADGFGAQDTHTGAHGLKFLPGDWITILNGVLNWGTIKDASGKITKYHRSGTALIKPNGQDFRLTQKGLQNIWGFYLSPEGETWMHEANNVGYPLTPYYDYLSLPMTATRKDFLRDYMTIYPPTGSIHLDGSSLSGLERSDDLQGGFPKPWQDCYFIAHPGPNKIHSVFVEQQKDQRYSIRRGKDFIRSKDPNFRPIDLEFGPDGCLYIVDWYNRVIDHNGVSRDHPARNKDYTRIWRVRHHSQKLSKPINLKKIKTIELPKHILSSNSWELHHAWREISERQDKNIIPQLENIVSNPKHLARHRIHALWSLQSLGYFNEFIWKKLLHDPNKNIRIQALKSLSLDKKYQKSLFESLVLLEKKESNFEVRKQLFHYFIEAKHFDFKLASWIIPFIKEPLNLTGRKKAIWHETPTWNEFQIQHISDLARMALEAHPKTTLAYLNQASTPSEHQTIIKKYILPYIKEPLNFAVIKASDLHDKKTRQITLAATKKSKQASSLLIKYFQLIPAENAIEILINQQTSYDQKQLNQLFIPQLKRIENDLFNSETKSKFYLRALLIAKQSLQNKFRSWPPYQLMLRDDYPLKLSKAYPNLNHLMIRLGHSVEKNKSNTTIENSLAWLNRLNRARVHKKTIDQFKEEVISSWSQEQKERSYRILAEKPYSLHHLLSSLQSSPSKDQELSIPLIKLISERYKSLGRHKNLTRINQFIQQKHQEMRQLKKQQVDIEIRRIKQSLQSEKVKANLEFGKNLFQAMCLSCHQVGQKGQTLAPNLDGVGNRHLDELLQAIVDPDSAIERNYRSTHLQFMNGQSIEGLVQENDENITVHFMGGAKVNYPLSDIAYRQSLNKSFMPNHLTKNLSSQNVKDLIVYIQSLK